MNDLLIAALRRKISGAEKAGDYAKARELRNRLAEEKGEPEAVAEPAEAPEPVVEGLDAVEFASPAARGAAEQAGMSAESFARRRKSSDYGFTKADVERIAAATDESD